MPSGLGGSNYGWYYLGPGCYRETYGVVYNYDVQKSTIDAQLAQMYLNGQRRLAIPIFFGHGVDTGSVMNSSGGNLAPRFRANLTNLLATIKAIGFVGIDVRFDPQGPNNPRDWTSYSEYYFQENWALIQNLHPIIAATRIPYHIDLTTEAIPRDDQTALLEYDQKLWNYYVAKYGKDDTFGFSMIPDFRVSQVSVVYGSSQFGDHGPPPVFKIDFDYNTDETASTFVDTFDALNAQGYKGTPWVVGEAFYNDAIEAAALREDIRLTGQRILYLTQWPDTPATVSCAVSIAPPLDFSNYQIEGF